jgi:hypothetical protein
LEQQKFGDADAEVDGVGDVTNLGYDDHYMPGILAMGRMIVPLGCSG